MSFIDYGFEVFSICPNYQRDFKSSGDYILHDDGRTSSSLKNPCYNEIITHLINLGSCTEKELALVRKELESYRSLNLTEEQILQLSDLKVDYRFEEIDRFIKNSNLENSLTSYILEYPQEKNNGESSILRETSFTYWNDNESNASNTRVCLYNSDGGTNLDYRPDIYSKNVAYRKNRNFISSTAFRVMIIQKDSEIIALKNENETKESALKEIQERNKKLNIYVKNLKDSIKRLKNGSNISSLELDISIMQTNDEIDMINENVEKLRLGLKDDQQSLDSDADEITKLKNLLYKTETSRKNILDELKTTKHHLANLENSSISQSNLIKKLQQECKSFEKQNMEEENEIERLLNIIQRLSDKYEKSKAELLITMDEVEASEQRMLECREQLTTMEREVGQLIVDLAECLGPTEIAETKSTDNSCAKARELTRGFAKVIREHEKCIEHRIDLMQEIDRLTKINRAREGICKIKSDAFQEVEKLKEIILNSESYETMKSDSNIVIECLTTLLDTSKINKLEQSYSEAASEASVVLKKFDKGLKDHEVYKRYEDTLSLELDKIMDVLKDVQKILRVPELVAISTSSTLEISPFNLIYEEDELNDGERMNFMNIGVPKKILNQTKNCYKLVLCVMDSLRDKTGVKPNYHELEIQLQKSLTTLDKTTIERNQLQNQYNDCFKKCKRLVIELEKLERSLNEKSSDLQAMNKKLQSSFEFYRKEKESMQKQITAAETKFQESVSEVMTMTKSSDDTIKNLQTEIQSQKSKIYDVDKTNEVLNIKLKESERMIEQLQNTLAYESVRKIDMEKFIMSNNKVMELVREKNELIEKNSNLQTQLSNIEKRNCKVQANLNKLIEDNKFMETCINNLKQENEEMVSNIANQDPNKAIAGLKYNELLEKAEKMSKNAKPNQKRTISETVIRGLEKEIKSQKVKLRSQQKEILLKEKEILDKNKNIESLNNQMNKVKSNKDQGDTKAYTKEIEILTSDKIKLENELKQTVIKHEDKLNEMQKQYKQSEIELHKNHNDSIRHLEAKYVEILKEERKIFNSQNWLQFLNKNQLQNLHNKICKSSVCINNPYENETNDDQKKRTFNKNPIQSTGNKKPVQLKKDARIGKISATSSIKLPARRIPQKEIMTHRSIIIPEKDYSRDIMKSRTDTWTKVK